MTTAEAAKEFKVTPRRIRALIASGRLVALKQGRDYWIEPDALEAVRDRKPGRPPFRAIARQ